MHGNNKFNCLVSYYIVSPLQLAIWFRPRITSTYYLSQSHGLAQSVVAIVRTITDDMCTEDAV
jgi:hypothetical protein